MIAYALAAAALSAALPVLSQPRADVPWVVAAWASDDPQASCDARVRVLTERGAACRVEKVAGGALVVVEGPPELEPEILRTLAASKRGAVFVEGRGARTTRAAVGAAPPARAAPAAKGVLLALAPTPSLFDVEGEALVLLVSRALPEARVSIVSGANAAALQIEGATLEVVKSALASLADKPLPAAQVAQLAVAAQSRVAERRAHVGVWARESGRAWLCTGAVPGEVSGDLGARLRARLVLEAISSAPP